MRARGQFLSSVSGVALCLHALLSASSVSAQSESAPQSAGETRSGGGTPTAITPLPPIVVQSSTQSKRRAKAAPRRTSTRRPAVAPPPAVTSEPGRNATAAEGPTPPPPVAASERTVTREEIAARPITRPGEVLEAAPGLIITQHSGEGKANQYFLRGYNLDHGTDLAIIARWHADQHAHPRARPGLCRPQFPDPRTGRDHGCAQGTVLRRRRRLLVSWLAAHQPARQSEQKRDRPIHARQFRLSAFPRHGFVSTCQRHAALCRRGCDLQRSVDQSRRHAQIQRGPALQPRHL